MNKIGVRLALGVLVVAAGVVWLSPYWAVAGLAQAAQANSAEAVADYVDLGRLRESFKGQLVAAMEPELARHKNKALGLIGVAFGAVAVDKVVDAMLTPEAITSLLNTKLQDFHGSHLGYALRLVASGHARWLDDSTFQISIDQHSAMFWCRDGLSWRLTSVRIPMKKPK